LQTENPRETLATLVRERKSIYLQTAHWTLDTSEISQASAVEAVTEAAKDAFAWKRTP
jgi:shikimate kinase